MSDDTTIAPLHHAGSILNPLTKIVCKDTRQRLVAVQWAEVVSLFVSLPMRPSMAKGAPFITEPEGNLQTGIRPRSRKSAPLAGPVTGADFRA